MMECEATKDDSPNSGIELHHNFAMNGQAQLVIPDLDVDNAADVIIEETIDKPEWTSENIKQLLEWVEELRPQVGRRKPYQSQADMWREIRRRFEERGCLWTKNDLISKFGDLIREYNNITRHNKRAGKEDKKFAYKSEFNRIFHGMAPEAENGLPYSEFWPQVKVNLLLSSIEALLPKVNDTRECYGVRNMWKEVQRRFADEGYSTTKKQICNKFTSLVRIYKYQRVPKRRIERKKSIIACESRLLKIIRQWPKRDGDGNNNYHTNTESEENVDDPCGETQSDASYPSAGEINQSILVGENTKEQATDCLNVEDIKNNLYRLKQEYLQRKIEYITKKEAHMMKKEVLLQSILNVLSSKQIRK